MVVQRRAIRSTAVGKWKRLARTHLLIGLIGRRRTGRPNALCRPSAPGMTRASQQVGKGSMRICGCKKSNDEVSHAPGWPSNATVMFAFQIDISIRSQSDLAVPKIYWSHTEPSCLISSDAELLNAFSCWTSNKRIRSCRGTTTDSKRFVGGGYS